MFWQNKLFKSHFLRARTFVVILLLVGSCSSLPDYEDLYGVAEPRNRILSSDKIKTKDYLSYKHDVQPILNTRCAVCHSCNDAPCQLNFTSIEGIDRGFLDKPVYDGSRFFSQSPTRLEIDATNTTQWRSKKFNPVLNERRQNIQVNLDNSLLYKVLTTKRLHDFKSRNGQLPEKYGIGEELVDDESFVHSQSCPDLEKYSEFAVDNPQWGMPFVLPALSNAEFNTIETWLEQGAYAEPEKPLSKNLQKQVDKWEAFLNGPSNKEQLMSRYIYEHLFVGHIYFEDVSKKHFFMLQRSKTPAGQKIDLISSVRPYDDPAVDKFYYRLKPYTRTLVDKTHMPYSFSNKRMKRYSELFLKPSYTVKSLPSYDFKLSANPFKTFKEIPATSRYQFMLDEAQFFISGFIKGPVCRGSIALSVIDDHFWVVFMNPVEDEDELSASFLAEVAQDLSIPSEQGDSASLLSIWSTYSKLNAKYLSKKVNNFRKYLSKGNDIGIDLIWDGEGKNDNAALTVYRHYDSATVLKGFIGEVPKTGWVIDYPLFERIHYLLVAGFNVYGKVSHQLSTRTYMDLLRREGEYFFLTFLPKDKRSEVHQQWYQETSDAHHYEKLVKSLNAGFESSIKFETSDVKKELFVKFAKHLDKAQNFPFDEINRCQDFPDKCKARDAINPLSQIDSVLRELSDVNGYITNVFPNVTFVRIKVDGTVKNDLVYTIVRNKFYLNNTSLLSSDDLRVMDKDTIDVVSGFVGSYPNFFIEMDLKEVDDFVYEYKNIANLNMYKKLIDKYGIRRSNPEFWRVSDWFYKKHQYDNPVFAGLFDLNRYKNR